MGPAFSVRDAERAGVGRGRIRAADLDRPFHGIRATLAPRTFHEQVACCVPRLTPGLRFSGRTAARLWGLPVPWRWHPGEDVVVVAATGTSPPRTPGIRGVRLAEHRAETWIVGGAPVVDIVASLFTIAGELNLTEAVTVIEALITTAHNYPGLLVGRPRVTREEVTVRCDEWARFAGSRTIRRALGLVREGVESPKETETRLLIVADGLPEPVVQYELRERGRVIARMDLAYPELRIAVEYEGDGHRTDQEQWRSDIRRQRDLEDRGWIVIRLTQQDLGANRASFLSRLRRALTARRPPTAP